MALDKFEHRLSASEYDNCEQNDSFSFFRKCEKQKRR